MNAIEGSSFVLRPWRPGDEEAVVRHANNRAVWLNLADRFPHPYTRSDAEWWIRENGSIERLGFAIEIDGEPAGGIGCVQKDDVYSGTGELGYWLGETFWGRGIVSEAVSLFVPYLFDHTELIRIEAGVFAHNKASARVLEKNGFECEGRLKAAVIKDGELLDLLLYARIRERPSDPVPIARGHGEV